MLPTLTRAKKHYGNNIHAAFPESVKAMYQEWLGRNASMSLSRQRVRLPVPIGGPKIVHAGCWSHAERYFAEAVQLNPQDPSATTLVARIDELFAIDADAR